MSKSTSNGEKVIKQWSYTEASIIVPYIRGCLCDLREGMIQLRHLYHKYDFDYRRLKNDKAINKLRMNGLSIFNSFSTLGIILYDHAYRGIALYPFSVFYDDGTGKTPREAFYVFKDSRSGIDNYVFKDVLEQYKDLSSWELPVPAAWKVEGAEPVIDAYGQR